MIQLGVSPKLLRRTRDQHLCSKSVQFTALPDHHRFTTLSALNSPPRPATKNPHAVPPTAKCIQGPDVYSFPRGHLSRMADIFHLSPPTATVRGADSSAGDPRGPADRGGGQMRGPGGGGGVRGSDQPPVCLPFSADWSKTSRATIRPRL